MNQPSNQLPYLLSIPKIQDCFFTSKNKLSLIRMNNSFHFQRISEIYYLLTINAQNYFIQIPRHNSDNIRIFKLSIATSQIILKSTSQNNDQIQFIFLDLYNHIKLLKLQLAKEEDSSKNLIDQEMIQDCYIPDAFYQLISSQIFVGILFKSEELILFTKKSVYQYHLVTEKYFEQSFFAFDIEHGVQQIKNYLLCVHKHQIEIIDQKFQKLPKLTKFNLKSIELVLKITVQSDLLYILTNRQFYIYEFTNTLEPFFSLIEQIPFNQPMFGDSCFSIKSICEKSLLSIAFLNLNKITIFKIIIPKVDNTQFQITELDTISSIGIVLEFSFLQNKLRLIHQIGTQLLVEFYDYNSNP